MEIRYLMVGDWFYDVSLCDDPNDPNDEYRKACRVGSIEHFQYNVAEKDIYRINRNYERAENYVCSQEKNIRPIPLTEELILKNKFQQSDATFRIYKMENDNIDIFIEVMHPNANGNYINVMTNGKTIVDVDPNMFLYKCRLIVKGNNYENYVSECRIKNVHELQHFFHMFGLHDLANDFKV